MLDDSEKQITPRRLSSYGHLFLGFPMLRIVSESELGYAPETVRMLVARLVGLQLVDLAVLVGDIPRKVGGVQPFSCDALEEILWFVHFTEAVYLLS